MFDKIISHFGSQTELADTLGVDKSAVSQWKVDGVPPLRAIQIERITDGKIKARDIIAKRFKDEIENRNG